MRVLWIVFVVVFIVGCSSKSSVEVKTIEGLDGLSSVSQDVRQYSAGLDENATAISQNEFESKYFSVWNSSAELVDIETAKWAFNVFKAGKSWGENLKLHEQEFFDEMKLNADFENYSKLNARALTLQELSLRAFPTHRPLLRDPKRAGEGFPFDYLQNSTVHANKPLLATHYSKDREWVHVLSSFAFGWVKTNEIVFLQKQYTDLWQQAEQVLITKEGESIYSLDSNFLFKSKIGMMFALIDEDESDYTVLAVSTYKSNEPLFIKSKISKRSAHKGILPFNRENINMIVDEILKSNYGWGGMYGQRDCSSTLRDLYAPFGIWLPRNSYQQSKVGDVLSLEKLSDDEKLASIKEKAVPFKTLLYRKGHIVLYVGTFNDEIVVFQNTWGIRTVKNDVEGRVIIGKTIFSGLDIGTNIKDYDVDSGMLKNLKSMNTLN
ncbi:MAG: SH3 domain-containing protein [Campylobacterota bacterium]|nr:SH3 domain-containing protein [Campylobacterota bacterium]